MKKQKLTNTSLVEQFQSGNLNALTVLVKNWHKQFCDKAYWIVKDKELAKDIAQDSWKIIIDKINDLKDPKNFSGWAMRIVYTKSLDAIKEANKKRIKQTNYIKEQVIEIDNSTENNLIKQQLLKAVNSLSYKQQIVIRLFYVEDYSLKEISKLLNISIGTTKSRLFHAREQLKKQLKNLDYEK